jgi:TolB-like protein/DNA-binding winged helix-turn-helix (wHTH) protein/tetratricopeptide (TPR) repeat protein
VNGGFHVGPWLVEPNLNTISRNGTPVRVEPKVMEVLVCLAQHAGAPVSKQKLLQTVWPDTFVTEDVLTRSISELRRVFEDDVHEPRVIQTIPKRGYRLLPEVKPVEPPTASSVPAPPTSPRRHFWAYAAVAVGALLFTAGITLYLVRWRIWPRPSPPGRVMLAVLPFQNLSGDPEQDYFSDGVTEEITNQVGRLQPEHLRVFARTSVMHYKGTAKTVAEIGSELHADYVLEGGVRQESGRVRVSAQLVQVKDQSNAWSGSFDRDQSHILDAQAEVARAIANEIGVTVAPSEHARLMQPRVVNPEVHRLHLMGAHIESRTNPDDVKKALDYLDQALRLDPNYAPAWALRAHIYSDHAMWLWPPGRPRRYYMQEYWTKAEVAAQRALKLDEQQVMAYLALAEVLWRRDWNWEGAEQQLRRAEKIAPNSAPLQVYLARLLTTLGRHDEALIHVQQAIELSPIDANAYARKADILYNAHRYQESLKEAQLAIDMEPTYPGGHWALAAAYGQLGEYGKAIPILERLADAEPDPLLAYYYAQAGRKDDARRILAEAERRHGGEFGPFAKAIVFIGLGDHKRTLSLLRQAYEKRIPILAGINVDPIWDPLRADPRFQDIQRAMNFR